VSGPTPSPAGVVVTTAEDLERFVRDVFGRAGMSAEHAGTVADVLVWANLRGVDSHGVMRIPRYVEMIDTGVVNPKPAMATRTETAAAIVIEADRAIGPVAMTAAMSAAVGKAREAGVGLALLRATTHTAALGYYTLKAAQAGMAAMALAGSWPNMAYHGARAAGVSTSPISIAVPGGAQGPVVLDMGAGVVAVGKLTQARKTGQPIPAGWALDARGNPTTDPQAAEIPLPLGGPKGSGLALMIELITSLIVANPILADHLDGTPGGRRHKQNGFALAIDIARFADPLAYRHEVDRLIRVLKALPRDPDVVEILMPGERGSRTLAERRREGIPIPRAIFDDLASVAQQFGVALPG
jgi:LDH2 family malate/lactate/ureidoglycolate dehydrogenase